MLCACTLTQPFAKNCYNNVFADATLNGGNPVIKTNGVYAVLDIWTWGGWIESFIFFLMYTMAKDMLVGTVVAIGFAIIFGLSKDLPLCVEGDIVFDLFGFVEFDVCKELGLDVDTIALRYFPTSGAL